MGHLKDMLERAMRDANKINDKNSAAAKLFSSYHDQFESIVGQPMIWKTTNHPDLKSPQLVLVEQPFQYFVLVRKVVYNVEAQASTIRYAVNYASLYSGTDTIESLELSV